MSHAITNLQQLLESMEPVLNEGAYVFISARSVPSLQLDEIVASIHEPEGLSVIIRTETAQECNLSRTEPYAWITLSVHSDLQAVGLTAAFSSALARENISCNVVAGLNHDHVFVPVADSSRAMSVLRQLQSNARLS